MEPKYQLNLTEEQYQILVRIFNQADLEQDSEEYRNLKETILTKDLIELDQ